MNYEESIKSCDICKKQNVKGISERITFKNGFSEYTSTVNICKECYKNAAYINDNGFIFLKYDNKLFCRKPDYMLDFGFRQIINDDIIDFAFNPDKFIFDHWLNYNTSDIFELNL